MLENENTRLNNSVIDLKARSMCDNLLFFNIDDPTGEEKEDTTEIILVLLEDKLEIPDARNKDKEDVLRNEKIQGHKNWGSRAISQRNRAREKEIVPRHEGSETSR
ncbi:Hypothetical predicted protein [Paramuricea clavata]|uniref:Uncharacterized protein n=1 Tax=Paramuricea clavata TaxID=317549 RepID=A0A7D9E0G5_PARCT|nr:Hypothetical predicted protein [Paramuricea clavata]